MAKSDRTREEHLTLLDEVLRSLAPEQTDLLERADLLEEIEKLAKDGATQQTDFLERLDRLAKDAVLAEKLREKEQRDLLEDMKRGAAALDAHSRAQSLPDELRRIRPTLEDIKRTQNIRSAPHDPTVRSEPSDSDHPRQKKKDRRRLTQTDPLSGAKRYIREQRKVGRSYLEISQGLDERAHPLPERATWKNQGGWKKAYLSPAHKQKVKTWLSKAITRNPE